MRLKPVYNWRANYCATSEGGYELYFEDKPFIAFTKDGLGYWDTKGNWRYGSIKRDEPYKHWRESLGENVDGKWVKCPAE